jgi:hypothetical protein
LYQPQIIDDDCGGISEIRIGSTWRKPAQYDFVHSVDLVPSSVKQAKRLSSPPGWQLPALRDKSQVFILVLINEAISTIQKRMGWQKPAIIYQKLV